MNAQIQSEAADWVVEFQTGEADARARERFAAWLRRSPEHVQAYIELLAWWEDATLYDRPGSIDIDSLIAAAQSEPNVVAFVDTSLNGPAAGSARRPMSARRAWVGNHYRVALAAAVVLLIVAGFLALSRSVEYRTGIGERRTVTLADGTNVELDADSRIRVAFSTGERRVTLLEGQAFFRVAKNAERPFVVVSGGMRVRDVGTQFDVNRTASGTIVTVVEGRVSVSYPYRSLAGPVPLALEMRAIEVDAGEEITVSPRVIPRLEAANVTAATAWTRNELIFDSTPLPQVALEFNRLNARQLVIEGGQLQGFHVSGVFPALDPTSLPRLLTFLRAQPGIQVTETDGRITVAQK
jgi:transmembrane sensor